ncbi:hypothetical protein RSOLAG1IB_03500 [Rhizoctonia solani AG-1 IB]|uniref:Uncharacterized protein n=1 Tax=Thanatephorus cucumeris (strain AG1-IB / isolate 7/3/14) TaxID=1108050 RepID=A0A0B7FTS8_THACB|nr:hypothetical protein RSOLAG1IB_03500 [Rhizoctonia solani AG-1 IB]
MVGLYALRSSHVFNLSLLHQSNHINYASCIRVLNMINIYDATAIAPRKVVQRLPKIGRRYMATSIRFSE